MNRRAFKKTLIILAAFIILLIGSAVGVSYAKWGTTSVTVENNTIGSFYSEYAEGKTVRTMRCHAKWGLQYRNYICVSDEDNLSAGQPIYIVFNTSNQLATDNQFQLELTRYLTDEKGKPTGAKQTVKEKSLNTLDGENAINKSFYEVTFGSGADAYYALDFFIDPIADPSKAEVTFDLEVNVTTQKPYDGNRIRFDLGGGIRTDDFEDKFVDDGYILEAPAIEPIMRDTGSSPADFAYHVFTGWYADKDYTTPFTFGEAVNKDTTVYAKFETLEKFSDNNWDNLLCYIRTRDADGNYKVELLPRTTPPQTGYAKSYKSTSDITLEKDTRIDFVINGNVDDSGKRLPFDMSSQNGFFGAETDGNGQSTSVTVKKTGTYEISYDIRNDLASGTMNAVRTDADSWVIATASGGNFEMSYVATDADGNDEYYAEATLAEGDEITFNINGAPTDFVTAADYGDNFEINSTSLKVLRAGSYKISYAQQSDGTYLLTAIFANNRLHYDFGSFSIDNVSDKTLYADQLLEDGTILTRPADPVIPDNNGGGYGDRKYRVFMGWYQDGAYTTPFVFGNPIDGDVTVYAKFVEADKMYSDWSVHCHIRLILPDGTYALYELPRVDREAGYKDTYKITNLTLTAGTRIDFVINGDDESGVRYPFTIENADGNFTMDGDNAAIVNIGGNYTIRYNGASDMKSGSVLTVRSERSYMTVNGTEYDLTRADGTDEYSANYRFNAGDAVIFTVNGNENVQFTVAEAESGYTDLNQGDSASELSVLIVGNYNIKIAFVNDEYLLYLSYNGNLVKFDYGIATTTVEGIALDQAYADRKVNEGEKLDPTTIPEPYRPDQNSGDRLHYVFVGWYTDAAFSSLYDFNQDITSDLTLYAKFETVDKYISGTWNLEAFVRFTKDGVYFLERMTKVDTVGNETIDGVNVSYLATYDLSETYLSAGTVIDFVINDDNHDGRLPFTIDGGEGYFEMVGGNKAKVLKDGYYTIKYSYRNSPARDQGKFSFTCAQKWRAAIDGDERNMTYEKTYDDGTYLDEYSIALDLEAGNTLTFNVNQSVGVRFEIARIPVGCFAQGQGQITGALTANVAGWYKIRLIQNANTDKSYTVIIESLYQITFDLDGGRFADGAQNTVLIAENGKLEKPAAPLKDGDAEYTYFFDGWYRDEALTSPFDFDGTIIQDTTVYAKFIEKAVNAWYLHTDGGSVYEMSYNKSNAADGYGDEFVLSDTYFEAGTVVDFRVDGRYMSFFVENGDGNIDQSITNTVSSAKIRTSGNYIFYFKRSSSDLSVGALYARMLAEISVDGDRQTMNYSFTHSGNGYTDEFIINLDGVAQDSVISFIVNGKVIPFDIENGDSGLVLSGDGLSATAFTDGNYEFYFKIRSDGSSATLTAFNRSVDVTKWLMHANGAEHELYESSGSFDGERYEAQYEITLTALTETELSFSVRGRNMALEIEDTSIGFFTAVSDGVVKTTKLGRYTVYLKKLIGENKCIVSAWFNEEWLMLVDDEIKVLNASGGFDAENFEDQRELTLNVFEGQSLSFIVNGNAYEFEIESGSDIHFSLENGKAVINKSGLWTVYYKKYRGQDKCVLSAIFQSAGKWLMVSGDNFIELDKNDGFNNDAYTEEHTVYSGFKAGQTASFVFDGKTYALELENDDSTYFTLSGDKKTITFTNACSGNIYFKIYVTPKGDGVEATVSFWAH